MANRIPPETHLSARFQSMLRSLVPWLVEDVEPRRDLNCRNGCRNRRAADRWTALGISRRSSGWLCVET